MQLWKHVLLMAVAGTIAGCGSPFLHSAAGSGPAIQDDGLTGEWTKIGPTTIHANISEPSEGAGIYSVGLSVQDAGELKTSLSLELTLTEIGGNRYADLFLARADRDRLVETYGFLAVPVHQVMKISRTGDELHVWSFNGSWLEGTAQEGKFSHDRITVGGGEVQMVTAPTDQVRQLIARRGNDATAFGEPMVFRRVRPNSLISGASEPALSGSGTPK